MDISVSDPRKEAINDIEVASITRTGFDMNDKGGPPKDLSAGSGPREILSKPKNVDLLFILLILVTVCVFFWKILLHPDQIIYSADSDIIEQYYPWRYVANSSIENGSLPFWNPYNFGGEPLIANMQLGFFYPLNLLLFWILPTQSAFGSSFILHLFIAGASIFLICRRLGLERSSSYLSSVVFIFSGYFIGHVYSGHYGQVCSASWIPMIFLLMDITMKKRSVFWGLLLGLVVGNQFLAGHVQISIFSLILMLACYLFHIGSIRKKLKGYREWIKPISAPLAGGVIAMGIALVQLIPTFEYTAGSTRDGGMSYGWATSYSFPPQNFLGLILPNLFGNPLNDNYWHIWNYWELAVFIGIPTIILVFLSFKFWKNKYVKFFTFLGIFSLIMAMGRYTPVYWIFWKIVPGFDILRVPSRFVLIAIFAASILAGFGSKFLLERLTSADTMKLKRINKVLMAFSIAALVIAISIMIFKPMISDAAEGTLPDLIADEGTLSDSISKIDLSINMVIKDLVALSFFITASIGLLLWRLKKRDHANHITIALVLLILLNLGYYHMGYIDTKDLDEIYEETDYISFLKENSEGYRVYDPTDIIEDNFQIIYGIEAIGGYNPLELKYYNELVTTIRNLSNNLDHPVLDMLNVKYILSQEELTGSGFQLAFESEDMHQVNVYENPNVLPRAFIVRNFTVHSEEDILERMKQNDFSPLNSVLLEKEPYLITIPGMGSHPVDRVWNQRSAFNEYSVRVNLTGSGFLVLSQSYYPAWEVEVNGGIASINRVNHGLCGIYLTEGSHKVRFYIDDLV